MKPLGGISIEIKARCADPARVRVLLRSRHAIYQGLDHQVDTYFRVPSGRLKLREGNIENALIFYKRTDQKNSKRCDAVLSPCPDGPVLKKVLKASLGILVAVDKKREIYFIKNAKFHLDQVKKLGSFLEIEVFGGPGPLAEKKLRMQCEFYQKLLGIHEKDLVADSYSDLLLRLKRRE